MNKSGKKWRSKGSRKSRNSEKEWMINVYKSNPKWMTKTLLTATKILIRPN
jgi:hypothetical protein